MCVHLRVFVFFALQQGANEAKDNVKYLSTLEKFVDPLYIGDPVSIIDALPALLNSLKMIHTIARYGRHFYSLLPFLLFSFTCSLGFTLPLHISVWLSRSQRIGRLPSYVTP